jgi:hypothetical protein
LRFARTCYDNLAGQLGVAIAGAPVFKVYATLTDDSDEVTNSGVQFLSVFGAELTSKSKNRQVFCDRTSIGANADITSRVLSARKLGDAVSNSVAVARAVVREWCELPRAYFFELQFSLLGPFQGSPISYLGNNKSVALKRFRG